MSIISIEQFEELSELYPELTQCYDLDSTFTTDAGEPIANTSRD
jgi:hypothetical protein